MKQEIRIFLTALMFYTRIPCPPNIDHSADYINKATRYFPLIGWIVGGLSFGFFYLSSLIFPVAIAIIISIFAGVLITGAFHEDGLADVFDGFGGGWEKQQILTIMKDSQVGTFGVIALIMLIALKFFGLEAIVLTQQLPLSTIALVFISYHAMARLTAVNFVFQSSYSREDEQSKAKPVAKTHSYQEIVGAYFFGLLPFAGLVFFHWQLIFVLIPLSLLFILSKIYFEKWIDGYTGDCLGAVEQFAECFTILSMLVVWKFM
jgi:adenosylcobinamide-GDP ribazoletransferase